MKKLETERLIIRKVDSSNLEDFYQYASNKAVGENSTWKPHSSRKESEDILNLFIKEDEYLGIHHKKDGKMIGILGLHSDPIRELEEHLCRELGYGLNYDYWNKGYMTEACFKILEYGFKELNLVIITATTSIINKKSQRVIEKIGMRKEGIIRYGWTNYKSEINHKYIASITREEYFK